MVLYFPETIGGWLPCSAERTQTKRSCRGCFEPHQPTPVLGSAGSRPPIMETPVAFSVLMKEGREIKEGKEARNHGINT
jgi:hypothetical protein